MATEPPPTRQLLPLTRPARCEQRKQITAASSSGSALRAGHARGVDEDDRVSQLVEPGLPHGAQVRRAADRFRTRQDGRDSWHAFSFGEHYDPTRTGVGPLVACNEDRLAPGAGYHLHRHVDVEVVTWVLTGTLLHRDSEGRSAEVTPGVVQRLSAGAGVEHAEHAGGEGAHLLQMWVTSGGSGGPSGYERGDVSAALAAGGWVTLAGTEGAVGLGRSGATLAAARLRPGEPLALATGRPLFVHVARGAVELAGDRLDAGDALTSSEPPAAASPVPVAAVVPAEVLVWVLGPG